MLAGPGFSGLKRFPSGFVCFWGDVSISAFLRILGTQLCESLPVRGVFAWVGLAAIQG
jgi:hypothetical protein